MGTWWECSLWFVNVKTNTKKHCLFSITFWLCKEDILSLVLFIFKSSWVLIHCVHLQPDWIKRIEGVTGLEGSDTLTECIVRSWVHLEVGHWVSAFKGCISQWISSWELLPCRHEGNSFAPPAYLPCFWFVDSPSWPEWSEIMSHTNCSGCYTGSAWEVQKCNKDSARSQGPYFGNIFILCKRKAGMIWVL